MPRRTSSKSYRDCGSFRRRARCSRTRRSSAARSGRVLVTTNHGELLLINAAADKFEVVSRLRVFPKESEVLSHPAIVGSLIYLRDMGKIECVDLAGRSEEHTSELQS